MPLGHNFFGGKWSIISAALSHSLIAFPSPVKRNKYHRIPILAAYLLSKRRDPMIIAELLPIYVLSARIAIWV